MAGKLDSLLHEKREEILAKWENSVLASYAPDAKRIFMAQQNQFANPIGHKTRAGLAELYDVLRDSGDHEVLTPNLLELIKVKAVQKISPSEAISFIFTLRDLVRRELGKEGVTEVYKEWLAFEARIEAAALAMFDMYVNSREQLYQVRINEFKQNRYILTDGSICPSKFIRKNRELPEAVTDSGELAPSVEGAG